MEFQMAGCPLAEDDGDSGFLSAAFSRLGRRGPIDEFGAGELRSCDILFCMSA